MRAYSALFCLTALALTAGAQIPSAPTKVPNQQPETSADAALKTMFESKVQAEWEALKHKDKKAYADLLADDYQGVEVDGKGERTKLQALAELSETNVFNYTLWGFKVIPAGPDAALIIYESTLEFPPKAQVRYSRVYITELWLKRAGQWKEVHYQETHVK